jgi:hypothetical protein
MSSVQLRSNLSHTLAEVDIDVSRLHGVGGIDYPFLYWQLQLAWLPQPTTALDYVLRAAEARLTIPPGHRITDARPVMLHRIIRGRHAHQAEEYLNFEFPLDARRIEAIERHRQGGSLKLQLDVQLQVDEYGLIEGTSEPKRPGIWGFREVHRLYSQEQIHIPQTQWIENVLPGLGYSSFSCRLHPVGIANGLFNHGRGCCLHSTNYGSGRPVIVSIVRDELFSELRFQE